MRKRQLRDAMARFKELDVDGSGALSLDELRALIPGDERQRTLLLAKFDDNGDGELQMKEFIQLNKFLWIQADRRVARDAASAACDALGCSGLVDDHAARLFAAACDGDEERCATAQRVLREWLRDAAPAAITGRLVGDCVRVATLNAFVAYLDDKIKLRQMPSPASRFVAAFAAQRMDAMLGSMPQRLTPEWKREVEEAWRVARIHLLDDAQRGAARIALPATAAGRGAEGELRTPVRSSSSSSALSKGAKGKGSAKGKKKSSVKKKTTRSAKKKGTPLGKSGARVRVNRHGSVFIG